MQCGTAAFITLILMVAYVLFGGVWGAGIVGIAKTVLLYIAVGACGIMAVLWQGGLSSLKHGHHSVLVLSCRVGIRNSKYS
ncbi:hypothetical protein FACS1894206_01900 [Deltaproteobacteria bacterium]|nr:hypothetical protein FACS1894206_01900 [Deltaproteobacteria bacterium]